LSLDGPPEIHDKNRIRLNGKGSFENAFETAKFFYERKFPIRLRSTISSTDVGKMLYIYEYFQNHFPKINISFEPLNPIGRGENLAETPRDGDFAAGYIEILKKHGEEHISYSAIPSIFKLRKNFCSPVATPNVNVSVDGFIHGCSRAKSGNSFLFGNYDYTERKFRFDLEKAKSLHAINVDSFEECNSCFARFHCAGDCHDLRQNKYFRCDINKKILFYLISEQLN
jgi:uncharacterized protein